MCVILCSVLISELNSQGDLGSFYISLAWIIDFGFV